jgi:hypothetical protein
VLFGLLSDGALDGLGRCLVENATILQTADMSPFFEVSFPLSTFDPTPLADRQQHPRLSRPETKEEARGIADTLRAFSQSIPDFTFVVPAALMALPTCVDSLIGLYDYWENGDNLQVCAIAGETVCSPYSTDHHTQFSAEALRSALITLTKNQAPEYTFMALQLYGKLLSPDLERSLRKVLPVKVQEDFAAFWRQGKPEDITANIENIKNSLPPLAREKAACIQEEEKKKKEWEEKKKEWEAAAKRTRDIERAEQAKQQGLKRERAELRRLQADSVREYLAAAGGGSPGKKVPPAPARGSKRSHESTVSANQPEAGTKKKKTRNSAGSKSGSRSGPSPSSSVTVTPSSTPASSPRPSAANRPAPQVRDPPFLFL